MKKRLFTALLVLVLIGLVGAFLPACGNKKDKDDPSQDTGATDERDDPAGDDLDWNI